MADTSQMTLDERLHALCREHPEILPPGMTANENGTWGGTPGPVRITGTELPPVYKAALTARTYAFVHTLFNNMPMATIDMGAEAALHLLDRVRTETGRK
jgi:hypothetical protein